MIKYGNEKAFKISREKEVEVRLEFTRQRTFLEQSIVSLKSRVNIYEQKGDSYHKIIEENTVLVKEIDKLRQELKTYQKKFEDLESILKIKQYKNNFNHQVKLKQSKSKSPA